MKKAGKIGIGVGIGLLALAVLYTVSAHTGSYGGYGFGFPMMGYGMMENGFVPDFNAPEEAEGPSLPPWMLGWGYHGYQGGGYGNGNGYGYGGYGGCPMMGW